MNMTIEQITAAYPNVAKLESQAGRELLAEVMGQLSALAAENAGLKMAVTEQIELRAEIRNAGRPPHADFWVQSVCMAENKVNLALKETPSTEAFLAEVRAQGVEMASKSDQFSTWVQQELRSFAITIRQGAAL